MIGRVFRCFWNLAGRSWLHATGTKWPDTYAASAPSEHRQLGTPPFNACSPNTRMHTAVCRSTQCSRAGSPPSRGNKGNNANRHPRSIDHFIVGQRTRDYISRTCSGTYERGHECCSSNGTSRGTPASGSAESSIRATALYGSLQELKDKWARDIRDADFVIVGSYVPQGVPVGEWVISTARGPVAFYDIDTPVTLAKFDRGDTEYISRALVMRYDMYLSFTGGPTLKRLEKRYYAKRPRELYCSVDATAYHPGT